MVERRVFDGAYLRADLYGAGRNGLFVSFDHWRGDARAGFPAMAPVQTALDLGLASLVISTAADDWFLNADLPDLRHALGGLGAQYPVVRGIGFSMGGYGALLLSRVLGLSFATLWAPQAAIRAGQVPLETRWRSAAARMEAGADTLRMQVNARLRGLVLMDPFAHPAERPQARAVQALVPGMAVLALPFSGHPPTGVVMAGGAYHPVLEAAILGTVTPAMIRALHKAHRWGCEGYLRGLQHALDARGAVPLARTGS